MRTAIALLGLLLASAIALGAHAVTITITDNTNPAGTTYNVYRGTGACSASLALSKVGSTATKSYTDSTVASGNTYCYAATAVNSVGDESVDSPEVAAVLPAPPGAVSITVTVQ